MAKAPSVPASDSNVNVVAVVNGAPIPRQALEDRLKRGGRGLKPEAALDELIRNEAIYQKALVEGFDREPEMQARIKSFVVSQYRERHSGLNTAPPVSEEEIQAAYVAQKPRFQTPETVRGSVIFIEAPATASPEKREERRRQADQVLAEARAAGLDERAFAQVVARHSEDRATRYRGGATGWLGQNGGEYDPALAEALSKLSTPGEFSPLVETARGFYVARLLEKREASSRPLGEVKVALRYQLGREKAEQAERAFQAALRSGLDIRTNLHVLQSVSAAWNPAPLGEPPALPGPITAANP